MSTPFPPTSLWSCWFLLRVLGCTPSEFLVSMTPEKQAFLLTGSPEVGVQPLLARVQVPLPEASIRPRSFSPISIPKPPLLSPSPYRMTPEWLWIFISCRKNQILIFVVE